MKQVNPIDLVAVSGGNDLERALVPPGLPPQVFPPASPTLPVFDPSSTPLV